MTQTSNIHYIVHPLWYLDNYREETIQLVDRLLELGRREGTKEGLLFILSMNDLAEYFDTHPRDWSEERLRREQEEVIKLHNAYSRELEQELSKSCRDLFVGKPIVSQRINKRTWQD